MRPVLIAFGRAVLSQLHFRMLLLTVLPFVLSLVIWGILLWLGLQPMIDWLHAYFSESGGFAVAGNVLGWLGLGALKTVLVPLLAMWVLLPLMILTALVFVGVMAMPIIIRHVGGRHYPELEPRKGGSLLGSLWIAASSFIVFAVLWLVTLPLSMFPPLTFVVQPALWGWLTYRVMAYDALAEHASAEECKTILRIHRWPLFVIGAITGAMGAAPTLLWLGGALSVIFFPLLAAGAIWLYVLVFVFTGLWFEYYCLEALAKYRALMAVRVDVNPPLKDIN
ncbi:MAG TPA: EI24 domain-containing protein [Noviherbaspirillum sp.]|uniref:EI24 domain-containing protein n=1 Tax=Noviherbaspirillum sp. TaxID=1926288 RepID=UPI002B49C121|nr:EI24 domain-containing protein [Noviherbaspirillum sp.]HJV85423.1 EI24 domain-containing protein [Noviherbaspirillum sp.]